MPEKVDSHILTSKEWGTKSAETPLQHGWNIQSISTFQIDNTRRGKSFTQLKYVHTFKHNSVGKIQKYKDELFARTLHILMSLMG